MNENPIEFLKELAKNLQANGSAMVHINKEKEGRLEGHLIICDEIASDLSTVRIRDPWHGWEITIDSTAFLDSIAFNDNEYWTTIERIIQQ